MTVESTLCNLGFIQFDNLAQSRVQTASPQRNLLWKGCDNPHDLGIDHVGEMLAKCSSVFLATSPIGVDMRYSLVNSASPMKDTEDSNRPPVLVFSIRWLSGAETL